MGYDKYRSKPKRVFDKNRKPKEKRLGEGLKVYVRNNDVDRALRKLKKMVNNEGVIKELKKREFYEKPSDRRRREKARARKRWLKQQAILEQKYGVSPTQQKRR
jgi:small subunit ribosomal protein S21|tara:strand:+ start:123 stop:434 length:312 start_codon:yes stop_codon:yes gene_type:complete